jgi:hypothetical protein
VTPLGSLARLQIDHKDSTIVEVAVVVNTLGYNTAILIVTVVSLIEQAPVAFAVKHFTPIKNSVLW